MSDTAATNPEALLAEAERRAEVLRASGELPPDIDQRLADDYVRASKRDVERASINTRPALDSLKTAPPIDMSRVETTATKPGVKTLKRFAVRLVDNQFTGLSGQTEEMRLAVVGALDVIVDELERQRILADNAIATADMLASRVASLEQELARLSHAADRPDAPTS